MQVATLVGDPVVFVECDASLLDVAKVLTSNEIGVVAVGAVNRPIGVISERDVVRAVARGDALGAITAADIASTKLVWCDAGASVMEVASEMMDRYVRHVFVESDGELVGIVSARDVLGYFVASESTESGNVGAR